MLADASSLVACTAALLLCESGAAFAISESPKSFEVSEMEKRQDEAGDAKYSSGDTSVPLWTKPLPSSFQLRNVLLFLKQFFPNVFNIVII